MTVLPNQSSSMRRVAKRNEPFTGKEAAALDFWCRLLLDTDCDTTARAVEVSRSVFEQYCEYFDIDAETFADKVVVDIGCGPAGALHHFQASHKFGVDVLAKYYTVLPIDWQDIIYLGCAAEQMPLMDEYVDVVISSNALDHVASFESAIRLEAIES
ncbi:MAG: methyltransferase domain-containing protein [Anaerolineae bacterium]